MKQKIKCKFCAGEGCFHDLLSKTACKVCNGVGYVEISLNSDQRLIPCKYCAGEGCLYHLLSKTACPICKGLGQRIITVQPGRSQVKCKICEGEGCLYDLLNKTVCTNCEGLGFIYPKLISTQKALAPNKKQNISIRLTDFEYDVAISFAGEDRLIAEKYANILRSKGIKVFYDKYEQSSLWGEDLYERLDDIYRKKARYCVIFISQHYARSLWTTHERKSAQARAFRDNRSYILPVKLDNTLLPGVRETIGYIDLRQTQLEKLVELTLQKLSR